MDGQRGQTSGELLGILLIAGAIVAAVAATPVPANIAGRTKQLVCRIGGRQCAFAPVRLRRGPGGGGLVPFAQGPPIRGGRKFKVLPFPGSVSVTCTGRPGHRSCTPPGGSGVKVEVSGQSTVARTETTLDENGCPLQTLSVSSTFTVTGSGSYEGEKVGGTLSKYFSHALTYSLTVAPGAADAFATHARELPNPMDPKSLRVGESIQMTRESYDGAGLEANYRALQLELGSDSGTRVSSGITRISPTTMRIYVGTDDFVRQALSLGVNVGDVNLGLGTSADVSHGKLVSVDVNIATKPGWAAYQAFLTSGKLPAPQAGAVSDRSTAQRLAYSADTDIDIKGAGLGGSFPLNSAEGHLTQTHNPDGSVTTVAYARYNDRAVAKTTESDGHGHITEPPVRSLLLHGVDPSLISVLYAETGALPPADPGRDLRLDFTEADLRQLQQYARELAGGPHSQLVDRLLAAQTPDDLLLALYNAPNAAVALNDLDNLIAAVRGARLPGTIVSPKC